MFMQYSQHVTPQLGQHEFCCATYLTISCTGFGKTSNLDEGREGDSTNGTAILGNQGDGVPPGVLVCRSQLLEGRFVYVWIL